MECVTTLARGAVKFGRWAMKEDEQHDGLDIAGTALVLAIYAVLGLMLLVWANLTGG
jgi:hypothetical protein